MTTLFPPLPCSWRKLLWIFALTMGLTVGLTGPVAWADGTNAAPAQVTESSSDQGKIGQYLVNHQADLGPFFEEHQDALVKEVVPVLISVIGSFLLFNMAICWPFDVGLGYGYSVFFAPLYVKIKKALFYASGRLALSVVAVLSGALIYAVSAISPILVGVMIVLVVVLNIVVQIVWVTMMYRTPPLMSVLFYVAIILTHAVLASLVTFPLMKSRINSSITQFLDQNVTSQLRLAVNDAKHDLAAAQQARDKTKADVAAAQGSADAADHEQDMLKQEIEQKKNSEAYAYSQVARIHAQGDLKGAQVALTDFLAKFPNGTLKSAAQAQLAQVESELAAQAAQQKQAQADAAAAAAAARADLLARAAKGQVPLSEMRLALIGKSRADVTDLLGQPTVIDSDRWGYSQKILLNPLTGVTFGLAVYFSEGAVQSVDYYYGTGAAQ